jgi:hypothetical protein
MRCFATHQASGHAQDRGQDAISCAPEHERAFGFGLPDANALPTSIGERYHRFANHCNAIKNPIVRLAYDDSIVFLLFVPS